MKWKLAMYFVLGLVVAIVMSAWLSYRWGYSSARSDMAEAREEAVRDAVKADRRERAEEELRAREREQRRIADLRAELDTLRRKEERSRRLEAGESAQRECLDPEQLEAYRSF